MSCPPCPSMRVAMVVVKAPLASSIRTWSSPPPALTRMRLTLSRAILKSAEPLSPTSTSSLSGAPARRRSASLSLAAVPLTTRVLPRSPIADEASACAAVRPSEPASRPAATVAPARRRGTEMACIPPKDDARARILSVTCVAQARAPRRRQAPSSGPYSSWKRRSGPPAPACPERSCAPWVPPMPPGARARSGRGSSSCCRRDRFHGRTRVRVVNGVAVAQEGADARPVPAHLRRPGVRRVRAPPRRGS